MNSKKPMINFINLNLLKMKDFPMRINSILHILNLFKIKLILKWFLGGVILIMME